MSGFISCESSDFKAGSIWAMRAGYDVSEAMMRGLRRFELTPRTRPSSALCVM